MNKKALWVGLTALVLLGGVGRAQEGTQLIEEEEAPIQLKAPDQSQLTIGIEALRQVLDSGQYLVGPGDEFLIHVTGMVAPHFAIVLAEGGVFIPKVGSVKVAGLRLGEARSKVEAAFYSTFKEGDITFELSNPRLFPVLVVGLVVEPGMIQAHGLERVGQVIQRSILEFEASRRNIQLFKSGTMSRQQRIQLIKLIEIGAFADLAELQTGRVDLDLFDITGDTRFNPFIEDGDMLFVPPQVGRVGVLEAVQKPGYVEFVPGDRIRDAMGLALGPTAFYDRDNVLLFRYGETEGAAMRTLRVDIEGVLGGDPQANWPLQKDDWLVFRQVSKYHQASTVFISGEVVHPGPYVVESNRTTLSQLLAEAGGTTAKASLADSKVVRPLEAEELEDPELERIASTPAADRSERENQYFLMKSRERPGQMVVDFVGLLERGDLSKDIALLPGDIIHIPTRRYTVNVSGQAANPGVVVFDSSYTVADYIAKSGGFSWRASRDVQVIKGSTGELKKGNDIKQVEPGDRIWIKEKNERDYWQLFKDSMEVVGQAATIILLLVSISK
ncbi:MAG: hypothetical protein GKR89_28300 [Candidatus Latescibacteria bacterium]|nr:hypothetical protein [Candidatus Latescibacterota bacterium]